MMELSHSLTLNEDALKQLPDSKKAIFLYEWLRYLDKTLETSHKPDIKGCQKILVAQLVEQMNGSPGPPTRKLLARCLATIFSVGDTFLLFETINKCTDMLKNKDDSPSFLQTRLAAVSSIGAMFEKLGRMMGRSYEETVQILIKTMKNSESQLRIEIMWTLKKITAGMGSAASNIHKDIYKTAKLGLTDRSLLVRSASAMCLLELMQCSTFLYTSELETLSQVCYRAFDGADYNVRCCVSQFLGVLLATSQNPPKDFLRNTAKATSGKQLPTMEDTLNLLSTGFLRGTTSFLKGTGEMIKGSSVSREIRVGITQTYVVYIQQLGGLWLERNVSVLLKHLTELVSNPKATSSHVEAVYSRKCVTFIMRKTIGQIFGEKAQVAACKEMTYLIIKQMNIDANAENKEMIENFQHVLICLLQELGYLIVSLSTTSSSLILDNHLNLLDAVVAVLLHPSNAARLNAAWCLRCISLALPSQLLPLITRSCDRLESLKSSPEAIAGYSSVVAAIIGCVKDTPLGIPHRTGKELFNIAEELLRSASQNSRLSLHRTTAGWLIIGSLMTLGVGVVRGLLPRMLLLWKNSFPRSSKEIESEKARGDSFTWQITLEGRAGALASMYSFLLFCPELSGDDTIRRMLLPIEAAVLMLSSISTVLKQYGHNLKASAAMLRLRLYEVLSLLPQQSFESHYTSILKLLVSEFTLAESAANTTTSLLRKVCHSDDSVILGSWLHETDQKFIEEQLQPNSASGSGALEHDPCFLYRPITIRGASPGPLPLGVAVIDASVDLFGKMFPVVANKHRLKMLNLFGEIIKAGKNQRQEAVQTNIFTAVLCALRRLSELKGSFGQEDVKKSAVELVLGGLTHPNPMLRCASGEAIGRMAQVVGDPRFVAELAQNSFDKLKTARDAVSRTGHSLALGCLHRYVGGMGSGQHLNTSISILLALAKDSTSSNVQVWSLHALSLIADSGGPMFRGYVEPSLSLLLELLLTVPPQAVDVHQCIGKCLQALITTIGPELQGSGTSVELARWSLLCGCSLAQEHYDPTVLAEAVTCLQQMHMFAPSHVNLSSLVPLLVKALSSTHLLLRRAAVSCLRQLSQKEAWEVCEHALAYTQKNADDSPVGFIKMENGLPGILFNLLDSETDRILEQNIHHTLMSMLLALATSQMSMWLTLCKEVLTSANDTGNEAEGDGTGENENDDDMARFHAGGEPDTHPVIPPRWRTRVFAANCVSKIIAECGSNRAHFDLALAREMQATKMKGDFLVMHLSELVRMGFMAATSESDELRLSGLHILNLIIEKFSKTADLEFPGHVILEQYQAQVGAALRPAFAPETASHVTSKACEVCSSWIGSGVARDLNDLRRVHQLLVTSLTKLNKGNSKGIYNESAGTLEKLAILKAWAEVYIVSLKPESPRNDEFSVNTSDSDEVKNDSESLLGLVMPELISLSRYWFAALKDFAFLSLPSEFSNQLPHEGGAFYSNETSEIVRRYYDNAWPPLLLAVALWLSRTGFDKASEELSFVEELKDSPEGKLASLAIGGKSFDAGRSSKPSSPEELNANRFYLLLGISFERLCSPVHSDNPDRVLTCLKSIEALLDSSVTLRIIAENSTLAMEIVTLMHRQVLSSEQVDVHLSAVKITSAVVNATKEQLQEKIDKIHKGTDPESLGEGGHNGDINISQSTVYATLQVCLSTLVRHLPGLAPQVVASAPSLLSRLRFHSNPRIIADLIISSILLLTELPNLCSPAGAVVIYPSLLFLVIGTLKGISNVGRLELYYENVLNTVLSSLGMLSAHSFSKDKRSEEQICSLLQSTIVSIIDLNTGLNSEEKKVDETVILRAVAVLVTKAQAPVFRPKNLQCATINIFKTALSDQRVKIRVCCVETLLTIFSVKDETISMPFIHSLAPKILELACQSQTKATCEEDVQMVVACISVIELLVSKTVDSFKSEVIGIIVGVLVGHLRDPYTSINTWEKKLHDFALTKLQRIGPEFPQEFRIVLSNKPDLRIRLENAVLAQRETKRKQETQSLSSIPVQHTPTIKLKTDFSNFAKS